MNRLPFRIAARELAGGLSGFWVYLACIALGVFAIAAAGSVTLGFSNGLKAESKILLGGDASFSSVQRRASPDELSWLAERGRYSEKINLNVMGEAGDVRRQVDVRAVDERHPLIGAPILSGGASDLRAALAFENGRWGVAATESLLENFKLQIGDNIDIGRIPATIRAQLDKESDGIGQPGTFGPGVTIDVKALEASDRLSDGRLFRASYRLILDAPETENTLEEAAEEAWGPNGLRYRGPEEAVDGLQNLLGMLNDFLSVIGIAALIAGGVGISQASTAFLETRIPSIAAFKSLGAEASTIRTAYLLQLGALALLGAFIGVVLGAATPFAIALFLGDRIPLPTILTIYPAPLIRALLLGLLTAAIFALPPLGRARATRPAALFRNLGEDDKTKTPWAERIAAALAAIALIGLAVWSSEEPLITIALIIGAAVSWLVLAGMAQIIRRLARGAAKTASGMTRLTLANLGGPGSLAPTIAPALGLGLGLLVFVASIQANILHQVNQTTQANLPSLFFTGIQNDDIASFDRIMAEQGVEVDDPEKYRRAPIILSRVTEINGSPVIPEDVEEDRRWVVESELFTPYVGAEPPEVEIVEGQWWAADYSGPLLVSVEVDAARGIGVDLGDTIGFRISGRKVTATVASLRNIDWGGFGASATTVFVFSPGTLEASNPQHRAIARTEEDIEDNIVKALGQEMPDIIVFQTRETLEAAVRLLGNISVAINAAASIVMLSGLLVLIGAFAAMARQRRSESALLKTFGATRGGVLGLYAGEFALSGAVATLFGTIMGVGAAWPVVTQAFNADWIMPWGPMLIVSAFAILAAALGGIIVGITTLSHPPARVLRSI